MQEPYYICAQPATFYYSWQVDAMLLSFQRYGNVSLERVHIVSSIPATGAPADEHFLKVAAKWAKYGVIFDFYKDTRGQHHYISSIRPHILKKHWQKYPFLEANNIFYHDCDIALTKPIDFGDMLSLDNKKNCYLSDTVSYIGGKYIKQKGHGILELMCDLVGDITPEEVLKREKEAGGAQYLLKPGINTQFWQDVYDDSENLFKEVSERVRDIKKIEPNWHEIQIWCADMWAVLWNLWKKGYKTPVVDELEFSWGTQTHSQWEKHAIFHNAGVIKEEKGKPFYKGKYQQPHMSPDKAPRPDKEWSSQRYYDLIVDAWTETNGKQPITHIAVVATNIYFILGLRFVRQFHKYCQENNIKYHFFSDIDPTPYLKEGINCQYYQEEHKSWQDATNSKFKNMLKIEMAAQDTLFYFDADTAINKPFSTTWFNLGEIVGGEHYGNRGYLSGNKGYDRNPKSKAYIPETDPDDKCTYYYGAFFGGKKTKIREFLADLSEWQNYDKTVLNYEPAVNDESYINKWFHIHEHETVPTTNFQFIISDKAGLPDTRIHRKVEDSVLQQLLTHKNDDWRIDNGQIVV